MKRHVRVTRGQPRPWLKCKEYICSISLAGGFQNRSGDTCTAKFILAGAKRTRPEPSISKSLEHSEVFTRLCSTISGHFDFLSPPTTGAQPVGKAFKCLTTSCYLLGENSFSFSEDRKHLKTNTNSEFSHIKYFLTSPRCSVSL